MATDADEPAQARTEGRATDDGAGRGGSDGRDAAARAGGAAAGGEAGSGGSAGDAPAAKSEGDQAKPRRRPKDAAKPARRTRDKAPVEPTKAGDVQAADAEPSAAPPRGRRKGAKQTPASEAGPAALRADTPSPSAAAAQADLVESKPRGRKAKAAAEDGGGEAPAPARARKPQAVASRGRKRAAAAPATSPAKQAARGGRRKLAGDDADQTTAAARSETKGTRAAEPQDGEANAGVPATTRTPRSRTAVRQADKGQRADLEKKGWNPFGAYARAGERLLVRMRPEKLTTSAKVIDEIRRGPQGPKVIAAFDFDGTLVGGYTGSLVLQERMKRKEVKIGEIAETAGVTFRAMARLLEANELVSHSMAQWAGKTEEEMEELGGHLFEKKIQDMVFPEMREIIIAHREAGHTIVVATSASRFQVEPTVQSLGIDHLLCTQVEVAEGKLTGKLVGDSLFGPGKVAAIKNFIAEQGGTLADTYFYADGDEEVGLMEAVGHPHPINPSKKLTEAARANGWPVLRLQSRGSNKAVNFVRGIAGLAAVMPILQAGLAVGLITRDKRQAANLIMPTWIQAQLNLAQVKLRVSGRKNLWARRPAVFIFNHRNNYDGAFVAALVRTDYVSLAKKEMANNPVGKLVAAIMPTVLIDREGGADPRATLAPVVEATNKGYSIMLAPEGTRVPGNFNSVGPFKKGAFHMAMAAGIPIVPVVIRNALDVAARDAGAMRPGTVDIAVLPPISVEDWTRETMNDRVEEVRQLFIETLSDWPEPDSDEEE